MLAWLGGKFPGHFSEANIGMAERSFEKWGMWAVFFGRFVALLRIFAGPLAGVLRMPYWKFLLANVFGGILWAGAPRPSSTRSGSSPKPGSSVSPGWDWSSRS